MRGPIAEISAFISGLITACGDAHPIICVFRGSKIGMQPWLKFEDEDKNEEDFGKAKPCDLHDEQANGKLEKMHFAVTPMFRRMP